MSLNIFFKESYCFGEAIQRPPALGHGSPTRIGHIDPSSVLWYLKETVQVKSLRMVDRKRHSRVRVMGALASQFDQGNSDENHKLAY